MNLGVPWSVGFDLDMTLVDTRRGIIAALRALADETGAPIDADAYAAALGPPITGELSRWFEGSEFDAALQRFRDFMADFGVHQADPFPGALEAIQLVQEMGGKALVVTAKHQPLAEATIASAGLAPDLIAGDLWAEQKATALLKHHAIGYVGDHPADVLAARTAEVWSVAVASGGFNRDELIESGATCAVETLVDAVEWLRGRLTERRAV